MNKNKKLTQGIILMITTLVLACTAVFTAADVTETPQDVNVAVQHGKAGIVASLDQTESRMLDEVQIADVTVEKAETAIVTVASKSEAEAAAQQENAEEQKEETMSKTEKEWQDKVMADVDDFLCIRAKGDADAEVLGKLYPTSVATVVKEGKSWTKIKSGSVKGYVKNDYLLFGSDAYENAKKVCKKYAYVQNDGLNVRAEASEEAKVLSVANKGDKLVYDKKADKVEGWVAVTVKAGDGYVSAEYVKVKLGTTEAVSIEEEIAAQKAKAAAAAKSSSAATQNAPTSASVDDTTLLAAIIQCEAGSECYEGKVAVGAVVLNRMRSSRYPNSISGVIYQRGQFGPARNGSLARVLASGNISSSCRQAAADALAGSDPTGGKLNFHRANGAPGLVIGNHVFF
ncbi:MAG: cell wall hydrolase [Eubacterium sp.]|nr:cell wall hydrolase [Eubacterium sp.]